MVLKPSDGYINVRLPFTRGAAPFDPYAGVPPDDLEEKHYKWGIDSVTQQKKIEVNKSLLFSKTYITTKRTTNPFAIDNNAARSNLFRAAKEVVRKSPDQTGDWIINQVLAKVNEVARIENLSRYETMQLLLSFCQKPNFSWILDESCTEIGNPPDYFRFPVETIYDKRGDCDCTALMGFVLFMKAGISSAYILMLGDGSSKHAAFAVGDVPDDIASSLNGIITIRGKKYYFCETVGDAWKVGVLPDSYAERLKLFEQEIVRNPEQVIISEDFYTSNGIN
jgi:hypothetical protein